MTKNESSKEMMRLKKLVDHWKEQAGLPPHAREWGDLVDIEDGPQGEGQGAGEWGWACMGEGVEWECMGQVPARE